MLTKISINGQRPNYAIIIEGCEHYESICHLQKALLWAVSTLAIEGDGAESDIWEIANLLRETLPDDRCISQIDGVYQVMALKGLK